MPHRLKAALFFCFMGFLVGYLLANAYLGFWLSSELSLEYLAVNAASIYGSNIDLFVQLSTIVGFFTLACGAFGVHFAQEKLTTQGTSKWQSIRDMKKNKLLGKPGDGFILAKTTSPKKQGQYITSDKHPNCLVVAPTNAGKGVGFVYPNLFTFKGSTVTLDIKGENYDVTARWRAAQGDKVFCFAPVEFERLSHRYNPLERIGKIKSYAQRSFETKKIATLFLQADMAGEWINGAIQLFTAAAGTAYERRDFTLGGIYKVLATGPSQMRKLCAELSDEAQDPTLKTEWSGLAMLGEGQLTSYKSVMNNAGFDTWGNPHVADMTSESDFSFDNLRRERTSIYFIVKDGDIGPIAGLVRLFFNELVATIQQEKPGPDEPYPVMLILDEFHLLGKMDRVANAMTTIRGFNGRIALVTQTLPKLDAIYAYDERLSIQGGAGLKLYMTPSDEKTIEDLSKASGTTTKVIKTKTQKAGFGERATYSDRTEEKPLLSESDARMLPDDTSIVIVNAMQPLKVKRIVHYEDRTFSEILKEAQSLSWEAINNDLMMRAVKRGISVPQLPAASLNGASQTEEVSETTPDNNSLDRFEVLTDRLITFIEEKIPQIPFSETASATETIADADADADDALFSGLSKPKTSRPRNFTKCAQRLDDGRRAA